MLGWARQELARRAVVSDATTYALENAKGSAANVDAMAAVQVTLEAEGIEFLNGDAPGVRLHPKMAEVNSGRGRQLRRPIGDRR